MINFATSMVGHWHGGLALAGCSPAPCLLRCRVLRRHRGGHWLHLLPCHGQGGFPNKFGAGVITTSGAWAF